MSPLPLSDGRIVTRDKVWHPGAVGILAVDAEHVWLTRQPREVTGMTDSLEIPAGKLDVPDEPPLECAQRELVEEIGMRAGRWSELSGFYSSAGFSDERVWLYLARELVPVDGGAQPEEDERSRSCRGRLTGSARRSPSARTPSR